MLLASCRITDVSEGERKELSYAIVKPGDFPPEIDQILRKKKESAFQMAYESGDDLYILRGYGKQKSGGFSIQIEEVSKSENAVFVRTKLVGPAAKEEQKGAASCPYVVLKTKAAAGISVVFKDWGLWQKSGNSRKLPGNRQRMRAIRVWKNWMIC